MGQSEVAANFTKHNILFADAVAVFSDDWAITIADPHQAEERFVTVGMDHHGRIIVVVYTFRSDLIRIVSARKATQTERTQYENKR